MNCKTRLMILIVIIGNRKRKGGLMNLMKRLEALKNKLSALKSGLKKARINYETGINY